MRGCLARMPLAKGSERFDKEMFVFVVADGIVGVAFLGGGGIGEAEGVKVSGDGCVC